MDTPTTNSPAQSTDHASAPRFARILFRKLWLPRTLYEALPYCYVAGGISALLSALYLPGWEWILPYLLLLGAILLHAGLALLTLRGRFRRFRSGQARED